VQIAGEAEELKSLAG